MSAAESDAAVELRDASVRLGGRVIWSGADLTLRNGTLLAVLGPNGAGKSTLLRLLLGLLSPAAGTVRVLGARPRRGNPSIGYVPQRRSLDAELPVRGADLVRLGVDGTRWGIGLPGAARAGRRAEVSMALQSVDAGELARRSVGTLSGGQQQRLFLAQALASRPRLLLLDEPLASLDVRTQADTAQLIARIAADLGIAVVMVTHDINPILQVTGQVLYVARGRVAVGRPDEIIRTEVLSDLYGTSIEVVHDSRGHMHVVGLENETAHPHDSVHR